MGTITTLFKGKRRRHYLKAMIGIDVSGSISDKNIEEFLSEIRWLMSSCDAEVEVVFFDTAITDKFILKNLTDMQQITKASGRGGTSYEEFFKYANDEKAREVIVFTDGYGDQNSIEKPPSWMRVWWVCNDERQSFPFGTEFKIKSGGD
jgi:predicted metal-dependent peptidase